MISRKSFLILIVGVTALIALLCSFIWLVVTKPKQIPVKNIEQTTNPTSFASTKNFIADETKDEI